MATAKTNCDALGIYRTGRTGGYSLGGHIRTQEIARCVPMVDCRIPGIRVLWASAKHAGGTGTIYATGTSALTYTGPDGTAGTAVTIVDGETKLLESNDTGYALRVVRMDSDNLGGDDSIDFKHIYNGVFSMLNVTNAQAAAGVVCYRGVILKNHAATGNITGIKINVATGVTGYEFATEAISGNSIQSIADETTAPIGLSFAATEITPSDMAPGAKLGLWLKRTTALGASGNPKIPSGVKIEFTYGGVTYTEDILQYFRVEETALSKYELFAGVDARPSAWTTGYAVATSATLPFAYALTPPGSGNRTYHLCALKRNAYDLASVNRACEEITIDSTGALIPVAVSSPVNISLGSQIAAKLILKAEYTKSVDTDPADYWAYWITTDGTNPDPLNTPTLVAMDGPNGLDGSTYLNVVVGPYAYGATIKALVRARRSSDYTDSTNATAVSATINTSLCTQVLGGACFFGEANVVIDETIETPGSGIFYTDETNNIFFDSQDGSVSLYADSVLVWRVIWADQALYINNAFGLSNVTVSAAGDGSAIETVAWNGSKILAVNVGTTRRTLIDLDVYEIQADTFISEGIVASAPTVSVPYAQTATETIFLVYDVSTATWNEYLDVDSSGVFTTNLIIDQGKTQAEIESL